MYLIPPSNKTFSDEEKEIIKSFVREGGILVVLGMDYVRGRDFNADIVIMDDVLSAIPLEAEIHFNYTGGLGNTIIDPFSNDSYLHINETFYTKPLRKFLGDKTFNLIIESGVLTISSANLTQERIIMLPPWAYVLTGDGSILYFEKGAGIFAMEEYGDGLVIVIGFALSLSDLKEPQYNVSWIDLGENKDFWIALIKNSLNIHSKKQYLIESTYVWLIPTIIGVILIIVSVLMSIHAIRRPKEEKKKEIKISEILKKLRRSG